MNKESFTSMSVLPPMERPASQLGAATLALESIRKNYPILLVGLLIGLALGVAHLTIARPLFTAYSTLLLDDSKVDIFQKPSIFTDATSDNAFVESQIEVIKSDAVAREVQRILGVTSEEQLANPVKGWFSGIGEGLSSLKSRIMLLISPASNPEPGLESSKAINDDLIAAILGSVNVRRVGLTFVVSISATAETPAIAQKIADAFPVAYLNIDREARVEATQQTVAWLEDRLSELRQKGSDADQAVETFKRDRAGQTQQDRGPVNSQLRLLESVATSYKNLYDSMQTRYLQTVQEESFVRNRGRIISTASLPKSRSWPRASISLSLGMLVGLLGAIGFAFARQSMGSRSAIVEQYQGISGLPCIATLGPMQPSGFGQRVLDLLRMNRKSSIPRIRAIKETPFGPFAEEIRRAAIAMVRRHQHVNGGVVIGIVSLMPAEGKSTVASNLAQSLGASGQPVLLVDLDARNPSLSRAYRPPLDAPAILENLQSNMKVWHDPDGMVDFMPNRGFVRHGPFEFDVSLFERNLSLLKGRYKFVIVDLPPLNMVADAEAIAPLVDSFLFVVDPERSTPAQVTQTIQRFDPARRLVTGLVLNKVSNPSNSGDYGYYG